MYQEGVATATAKVMKQMHCQHMQVRSGLNTLSEKTLVFGPAQVAGQGVADFLNTAVEALLRRLLLAKHHQRRYAG